MSIFMFTSFSNAQACEIAGEVKRCSLKVGETLNDTDYGTIHLISVNDGRCPADVQCIWEGKADIVITMETIQKTLEFPRLPLATEGNTQLEVIEVTPYPESKASKDPPRITFALRKAPHP